MGGIMHFHVAETITNYRDILYGLNMVLKGLNKENPTPSFVFVVESKIRAYQKKIRILQANNCITTKVYKCDKCGKIE